ncbi:MAG: GAF domain-containing protein [Chloroflexi bacterium]|nr:MAG: GAF domain-containing protein [Chloroflexota bacterium]
MQYQALYQLSRALHQLDEHKILSTAVHQISKMVEASYSCILVFHQDSSIKSLYYTHDSIAWDTLFQHGMAGYVYHSRRMVIIWDIANDPRWCGYTKLPNLPQTGSAIGLPLLRGQNIYGVFVLIHHEIEHFNDERLALLQEAHELITIALNNALDYQVGLTDDMRYLAAFNDAVVPILLTDLQGTIIDLNHQAINLLGFEPNELIGMPISSLHELTDFDLQNIVGERILQTRLKTNNAEIAAMVRVRQLHLHGQDVLEWVEQDITPQMELEQLRRDLTAMVYHDLRGPLQTIHGSIQRLARHLANHEDPSVWNLLQVGLRSTRQLRRMVDSLLDIQRLEEGKAILNRHPTEVRVLLADAVQLVQPLAVEANMRLKFAIQDDLPLVDADVDMIVRVVINLIENAIKYTPAGEIITLGAFHKENQVYIHVKDSGPGIPSEMKQQIFDKFSRVKYHHTPKGIGLGLAFCRLAVQAHGGHIWVESEPGQGSDFIFTLPASLITPQDETADEPTISSKLA